MREAVDSYSDPEYPSLIRELREAGYTVTSTNDFLTAKKIPPDAVRVLLRYVFIVNDPDLKDSIVRGLTAKEVREVPEAASALIELFRRPESSRLLRWSIGNAMTEIADERVLDDLIHIVQNKDYGISRQMCAVALGRFAESQVVSVLIEGLEDDEIAGHCAIALGKLRAKEAIAPLEAITSHPRAWVRAEAKRALKRIRDVARTASHAQRARKRCG